MRGKSRIILFLGILVFCVSLSKAQENKQITCTGKVVDQQDKPLGDIKVTLYEMSYAETDYTYDCNMVEQVNTGADGSFSFKVQTGADGYRYGYIVAQKEGLAIGPANWDMREDLEIEIKLGPVKDFAGVVVDENDKPVSGAMVSISYLMCGSVEDRKALAGPVSMEVFSVETDDTGKFGFTGIPVDATAEFIVEKSGKATVSTYKRIMYSSQKLQFTSGQKDIKLVMPVEAKIQAVVVEKSSGKPVTGVQLQLMNENNIGFFRAKPLVPNEDGTFSMNALAPDKYTIQLVPLRDRPADWIAEPVEVITEAGKTKDDIKIEVCKGGILEVKVKDAVTKQPVEKASVGVMQEKNRRYQNGRSDENGIAKMRLMPGNYLVNSIYKQGYSQQAQQEAFTIEEGKTEHLEFELVEPPKISGIVHDENGKPLADTEVRIYPRGGRYNGISGEDGKFEVNYDLSSWPGEALDMYLVGQNEELNLAGAVEIDQEMTNVDLILKPGVSLAGKVVDPNNKGIANAEVRVMFRGERWGSTMRDSAVITDKEGKFEVNTLPAESKYGLYATADGYGENHSDDIIAAADAVDNRLDIGIIELNVADLSVSGFVVDVNDNPVPGARIHCYGDGQPNRNTQTDSEGKFTLESVCAGRIQISADSMGGSRLNGYIQTDGGATGVKIVISERPTSTRYVPSRPPSLVKRPLPDIKELDMEISPAETENKIMLVCFFDMNQRPSRHCINQLVKQAAKLKLKDITVIAVQISKVEKDSLDNWAKDSNIPFPVAMVRTDEEKARFTWGVRALPWLILTDKNHIVTSNGFALNELNEKIK